MYDVFVVVCFLLLFLMERGSDVFVCVAGGGGGSYYCIVQTIIVVLRPR